MFLLFHVKKSKKLQLILNNIFSDLEFHDKYHNRILEYLNNFKFEMNKLNLTIISLKKLV